MKAVAREELPTNLLFSAAISEAPFAHLNFSSESELIKVSAVLIFFLVLMACCYNLFLLSSSFWESAFNRATLSLIYFNFSRDDAN